MATSEAKEIKKQEILVRFSIISYKTRLRVPQYLPSIERHLTSNSSNFFAVTPKMTSKDYQICEDRNRTEMGFEANYSRFRSLALFDLKMIKKLVVEFQI